MTPIDFAKLCAKKYEVDKRQLEERVKGRGHEPREVVDRRKPLMALLQVCRICTEQRGGVRPFQLTSVIAAYRTDLFAAGLNPDSGGEVRCILSKRHWRATFVRWRLTGELPQTDAAIARRVEGLLTRRQNRFERELKAELAEKESAAQRAREIEAQALASRLSDLSAQISDTDPDCITDLAAALAATDADVAHNHRKFFETRRAVKYSGANPRALVALWRAHRKAIACPNPPANPCPSSSLAMTAASATS